MLDTRSYQKPQFEVSTAAKKLGPVIDAVSQKPVFVVAKSNNYYQIRNYYSDRLVVNNLPTRIIAEEICSRYNRSKPFSAIEKKIVQTLIRRYAELEYEKQNYIYLLKNSDDVDYNCIIRSRYDVLIDKQKIVEHSLITAVSKSKI